MPRLAWTAMPLFVLPGIAGMIGMCHLAQPLVEMGSCKFLAEAQDVEHFSSCTY
jgi:hypothetical protein